MLFLVSRNSLSHCCFPSLTVVSLLSESLWFPFSLNVVSLLCHCCFPPLSLLFPSSLSLLFPCLDSLPYCGSRSWQALRAEIAVLKLVNHPNIIRLKNQFETRKLIYLVTQLVTGGDLFDRICSRKRFAGRAVVCELHRSFGFFPLFLADFSPLAIVCFLFVVPPVFSASIIVSQCVINAAAPSTGLVRASLLSSN